MTRKALDNSYVRKGKIVRAARKHAHSLLEYKICSGRDKPRTLFMVAD